MIFHKIKKFIKFKNKFKNDSAFGIKTLNILGLGLKIESEVGVRGVGVWLGLGLELGFGVRVNHPLG